ncbi:rRNA maturation RNase YbeY [Ekhidna sp. To15]|uniref:rRNA maturation RNase YbeY n=1 Tax=Ekhidna sp. To15 TaxID=3395267 RepID=UPI003F51D1F8
MKIHYFYEDVDFRISHEKHLSDWITSVVHSHDFIISEINYIFCTDEYLLEINRQHLNHDYYTDIITFDNADEPDQIESDIFISIDRVKENASNHSTHTDVELHRVMIHGILHLIGFGDKSDQEKKVMREKEDACLSLLKL